MTEGQGVQRDLPKWLETTGRPSGIAGSCSAMGSFVPMCLLHSPFSVDLFSLFALGLPCSSQPYLITFPTEMASLRSNFKFLG